MNIHIKVSMQCKINEQVSVVFDNRCNGLSQGLAKKIHNTAYLTNTLYNNALGHSEPIVHS